MDVVKGSALSNPSLTANSTASPTASGIAGIAGIAHKYERIILQNKCRLEEDCSICLDSLYMKQIAYLPCKHSFHQKCIQYSFEKKLYSCPLCRHDLLTALKKTNFSFPIVYDPYTFDPYTFDYTYPYPYGYNYIYDYIILADGIHNYTNDIIDNNHNDFGILPLIVSEEYNMQYWSNIMVNIMPAAIPLAVGVGAAIPLAVGVGAAIPLAVGVGAAIPLAVGVGAAIPLAVGVGSEVGAAVGGAVGAAVGAAVGGAVGAAVGAERVEPNAETNVEPSTDDDNITFHEFLIFYN